MTQLNIWGQIALMVEKIQNRRDHLASLTAAAKIHQEDLETMEEGLQKELASLEKAQDLFEKAQKESDGAQGRVNFLQRSIALIRARPEINRIDETKVNLAKNKFARGRGATPVATPVAGTKRAPLPRIRWQYRQYVFRKWSLVRPLFPPVRPWVAQSSTRRETRVCFILR